MTQTSQVTEFINKAAVTLLAIAVLVWVSYWAANVATSASRTRRDLASIAVAAQRFYKQHNRWPRDLLEMRNDRNSPVIGTRDQWRRRYVFVPPTNGKRGRIETYGADGIATGRKEDGDAAVEFDGEEIFVVPVPPS